MWRALKFAWLAFVCYRRVGHCGTFYAISEKHGVPDLYLFSATGREAWRVWANEPKR